MQQVNPSGQAGTPGQQKSSAEQRKKLDDDLKAGKISQAEYFKQLQALGSGPASPASSPSPSPVSPTTPQLPPPAGGPAPTPGVAPITPISPVSPISPVTPVTPQQVGPKEEVPPVGQALAIGSEDVEVVECYKCGGLITITTKERPVIIACPSCGTKGEVDATKPEKIEETSTTPKATEGVTIDEDKIFKFGDDTEKPTGPKFGASLDEHLAQQELESQPKPAQQKKPEFKKTEYIVYDVEFVEDYIQEKVGDSYPPLNLKKGMRCELHLSKKSFINAWRRDFRQVQVTDQNTVVSLVLTRLNKTKYVISEEQEEKQ